MGAAEGVWPADLRDDQGTLGSAAQPDNMAELHVLGAISTANIIGVGDTPAYLIKPTATAPSPGECSTISDHKDNVTGSRPSRTPVHFQYSRDGL